MRLVCFQSDLVWNSPAENVKRFERICLGAGLASGDLVILPEMFTSGFSMLVGAQAKEACRLGSEFLGSLASNNRVYACGSLPYAEDSGYTKPFNTLRIFGPAGHLGDYSKIHLFGYGGESESYTAGNSTLTLPLGEIGASFFICYDLRFPAYFSKAAPQTHLYVVVANWPKARLSHFLALARARAIENQAYVAAVNRVGNGGGLEYTGGSTVFTPKGEVLAELGDEEGVLKCDISPQEVEQYRREFPFLRDRVGADLFSQG